MWLDVDHSCSNLDVANSTKLKDVSVHIDEEIRKIVENNGSFSRNGRKCAYVTLASPGYDFGLKVLLPSIRRHSDIPIIVLATRRWGFETAVPNVYLLVVPALSNERYDPDRRELGCTLTKLWVFGLLCLERVVFLDADCLVLKPIDDLFDTRGFCCAPDCIEGSETPRFNSGLMAFDPSSELRDVLFDQASRTDSYDHGDQGLLNNILRSRVTFLAPEYNVSRHYSLFHGPELAIEAARVIHYVVKKPWELHYRETPDAALLDLDELWTRQLSHKELLQLVSVWRRRQFLHERPRLESLQWRALFWTNRRFRYVLAFIVLSLCLVPAILIAFILAKY